MQTLLIAEIGQAHEGSLGNALCFIDAVADAGANAVKFQCHDFDPNNEMPEGYLLPQDGSRQSYWQRTGFVGHQWTVLSNRARERGLKFGVTPFSIEALELVADRCDFLKISRNRHDLIGPATETLRDIIITDPEERQLDIPASSNFSVIGLDRHYWNGISDHSGTIWPALSAVARGASIVEVHVCWSRKQFGPDTASSLTIEELSQLAEGIEAIENRSNPS